MDRPNSKKCEICSFENPVDHFYCGRCGNALAASDKSEDSSLINAPIEGERKQVTIIFADISGFTALNDAAKSPAEVERVVRIINFCLQELSEAIYEYDGHIDKYIGDAIMAVFGAPRAHEDDPERTLRAALAMKERLEKFNQNPPMPLPEPLGIHMGINTGTVIAGMVGTDRKRSYTVMGDAVNVASRLEDVSERGEILISENTYNLTSRLFVFNDREPVKVKGKRAPLKIYELKTARDLNQTQRGLTDMEASLIGREYETKILLEQYQKLAANEGGIVAVIGDAGLGKSRLIAEFRQQVEKQEQRTTGPLWLFGRGLSYRQSFANRLFVEIIHSFLELPQNPDGTLVKMRLEAMGRQLFGSRQNEVVPYLATLLGLKLDEETTNQLSLNDPQILQQRIFVAVGEWVETLAARQPVIMVFEDLHWADPSSVNLIQYLFTLTFYTPLLMICVSRPDRDSDFWQIKTQTAHDFPDRLTELTLWPLTDAESRRLIKDLLKMEQMPAELEHLLLSRSEGNPLFLEEVLRSLIEDGTIKRLKDRWEIARSVTEIDIPNTLQGVLTARIDRLSEPVKRVLQIAAVIGRVFPGFVLKPIVNDPQILEKALNDLEVAELIEVRTHEPEPEYMFKHVLTYETAYNSLLHQQRKLIHKQIGDYMSRLYWELGEEYAAIVADHYLKSETWPRALRYLHRAAEAAIQSFANEQAVQFYTQALEVADILGSEADQNTLLSIYEGRARVLARLGKPQQAIEDFQALLHKAKELDDDSARMRALNGIGSLHTSYYDFSRASEFFQKALKAARHIGDEHGIAETLNRLGSFYYNMGQLELATKCYREASEISAKIADERRRIEAEDGMAKVMIEQGELMASRERYETDIIQTRRRLGYRTGLMDSLASLLMSQIFLADYQAAHKTAEEALELHQKSGDQYYSPFIRYYQSLGQLYLGELGQAGQNLKEGLALAYNQKQKAWQALGMTWMAYYYLTIGLYQPAQKEAEASLKIARELGSPLYVMRAQVMCGAAYRHLKQTDQARQQLELAHKEAQSLGLALDEVMILYQLARTYMNLDLWQEAEQSYKRMLALTTASEMNEFIVRAKWLQSFLDIHYHRHEEALNALFEASTLAEKIDSRLSQYLIQIQKSYVYRISGNMPAARDAVIYAQKIQNRLVDSITEEKIRHAFLAGYHARHLQESAGDVVA